mmetsp:Transcript_33758/g.85346  ORF Transcript_33758/g.85346 Transcript_33758/m.85346 type:complete len:360 (+) Transcript_33758:140-1219(+)
MSVKGAMAAALPRHVASVLDGEDAAQTGAYAPTAPTGQPAKAAEEKTYECLYCHKTFGRLFILKRHEKMHTRGVSADPTAPTAGRRKKAKCACTNCQASKQACDDQDTCEFCQKRGLVCERVAKPVSSKRAHQPLVPHPPAERPPKSQTVRKKQHVPTITTPMSLKVDTSAPPAMYNAGWQTTPTGSDAVMEDFDMSEASTVRQMSESDTLTSATSDTITINYGCLSDDEYDDGSPDMGLLIEDDAMPYPGLSIRTTPDDDVLVDDYLRTASGSGESLTSSPHTASPNGIWMVDEDEEMLDEFDEEEEAERLREQEQLLLIEQETMLRLSEQQRMNEQQQLQLQMMMNHQNAANSMGFR